jgi:hypothetical protein
MILLKNNIKDYYNIVLYLLIKKNTMVGNINERDIMKVASSLSIELNNNQINRIMHLFQYEEECDINACHDVLITDCILQVIKN